MRPFNASLCLFQVSCIHWVEKEQLAALEYVIQNKTGPRVNVGVMMANQGKAMEDIFSLTARYMKEREKK